MKPLCRLMCLIIMLQCCLLCAEEPTKEIAPAAKTAVKEETVETTHTMTLNGVEIKYKAIAGTLLLKDDKGEPKASVFYVSYIKEGEPDKTKRPITYCFNGGPGSSSIWLHMGVLGPKRMEIKQDGFTPPPYRAIDNPYCFLDVTDLVFIDPVSTGYSKAAPGEDPKQFHGVEEDVKSVADFIRLYTTRSARWSSPKFLAGESYGTTRAAALAEYLHDEHCLYLNGIMLVSSVLNFQTLDASEGNDLPYILFLPSYTATAWYHQKLSPELQQNFEKTLEEAEAFAMHEYALALLLGDKMDATRRTDVVEKLSRYTGLSKEYIERANLRVSMQRFGKELLRDQRRSVGRFDSRFKGFEIDACDDTMNFDPSADAVYGQFAAAFYDYMRTDLKWERDEEYKVLADVRPWNYGKATNKYLNVADNLRGVMSKNPSLKVFVANGYFDLATPYFATDYTFNHLGLDPALRSHVTMSYYGAGHMMYIHPPSLEKIKKDMADFITNTLK